MTTITPVRDDEGPVRLGLANDAADLTGEPGAVAPYPAIAPYPPRRRIADQRNDEERRRRTTPRRATQRRREDRSVWLDTRGRHERRTRLRRREDRRAAGKDPAAAPAGIDRYA